MTDAEVLNAIASGRVNIMFLSRKQDGTWEWYDTVAYPNYWRPGESFRECVGQVLRQVEEKKNQKAA